MALYNISRKECLNVYLHILNNSDDNWVSAEILAEKHFYGQAVSMLTISIEELIKCIVVLLDGQGFDFRTVNSISKFFRDHGIRYYTAFLFLAIYIFADEMIQTFKNLTKTPGGKARLQALVNNKDLLLRKGEQYILRKLVEIQKELQFFIEMDANRQRGFYCDYEKTFISPAMINEEMYKQTYVRLEKVRNFGKFFIDAISDKGADTKESFDQIKKSLKEANAYKLLSNVLDGKKADELFEMLQLFLSTSISNGQIEDKKEILK